MKRRRSSKIVVRSAIRSNIEVVLDLKTESAVRAREQLALERLAGIHRSTWKTGHWPQLSFWRNLAVQE